MDFDMRLDYNEENKSIVIDIMPDDNIYMISVWENDHWNTIHLSKQDMMKIGEFILSSCGQELTK